MSFPSWPLHFFAAAFLSLIVSRETFDGYSNNILFENFHRMFHVKHSVFTSYDCENNEMRFFSKKRGFGLKYTENML